MKEVYLHRGFSILLAFGPWGGFRLDRGVGTVRIVLGWVGLTIAPWDLDYLLGKLMEEKGAGLVDTPRREAVDPVCRPAGPPEALVGALQDNVHIEVGKSRPAKVARAKETKGDE
jgi:hypothetical protein